MILTCPRCAKRYLVADTALPAGGRQVRCGICRNSWTAHGPDPLPIAPPPSWVEPPPPRPSPVYAPPPDLPDDYRPMRPWVAPDRPGRNPERMRTVRAFAIGAALLALTALIQLDLIPLS